MSPTDLRVPLDASSLATRRFATLTFLRGAMVSLALALTAGLLAVLHYVPATREGVAGLGLSFQALRPLHTTFASAWIFLGGVAVVHRYLEDHAGPLRPLERWRLRWQVALWALAGVGVLVTLPLGVTTGREYMEFHPLLSIPIAAGWVLFAAGLLQGVRRQFWGRPIYVTMWAVGCAFFLVTFAEQHAYLLPGVFADPIADLRIQWKACGTLVGSFNLFVYGALYYVGERLSGDEGAARSRLAYALFGVGLLNSFTNYAHHTYHLPQRELVKWISFAVSMAELVLLAKVVSDLAALARQRAGAFQATRFFLSATKWWTCAMLFGALLLSVPPLNSLVHGTHVVTAHAMGTEIGIDSMALFAALSLLLGEALERRGLDPSPLHGRAVRWAAVGANAGAGGVVGCLTATGVATGVNRYQGLPAPGWAAAWGPYLFAAFGLVTFVSLASLVGRWLLIAFVDAQETRPASVPEVTDGASTSPEGRLSACRGDGLPVSPA